jgi:aspartyl-tRNA(Asn)/glutamyl-tRNA(Gln) amidotransferase subunit C
MPTCPPLAYARGVGRRGIGAWLTFIIFFYYFKYAIILIAINYINSMKISPKEVDHMAKLARIKLSKEEGHKYGEQLSSILEYVNKLKKVDVQEIEPTSQVTGLVDVRRQDKIDDFDEPDKLVDLAPDQERGYIKVKAVFKL